MEYGGRRRKKRKKKEKKKKREAVGREVVVDPTLEKKRTSQRMNGKTGVPGKNIP